MNEHVAGPMRLAGTNAGVGRGISPKAARERRTAMANFLSAGLSTEELIDVMMSKFGDMSEDDVLVLRDRVMSKLNEEFIGNKKNFAALASRRLSQHILNAQKARAWGAVANLENQLARIQGTEQALEQHITIDARLSQATALVLGNLSHEQLDAIIRDAVAEGALPPGAIDVLGEPVMARALAER